MDQIGPAAIGAAQRERVEDFLAEIAFALDDDRLEEWPGFFTEDAVYRIVPRDGYEAGRPIGILLCEGRGMMRDRVLALRTANIFEPHTYCHLLGRPRIACAADGVLSARSNFVLFRTMQGGGTEVFAAGKYVDRVVEREGALLLAGRDVVVESRRVDILVVLPI